MKLPAFAAALLIPVMWILIWQAYYWMLKFLGVGEVSAIFLAFLACFASAALYSEEVE